MHIHLKSILAAVVASAFLATLAMAKADRTLGVAQFAAVVQATGELIRGSGAVSAENINLGTYKISFDRNVRDCTYVANAGSVGTAFFSALRIAVVESHSFDPTAAVVRIFNKDGQVSNSSFHLIVFCAK